MTLPPDAATLPSHPAPRPTKYCQACGRVVDAAAVVCPACGVAQADMAAAYPAAHPAAYPAAYPPAYLAAALDESERRRLVAVVLCALLGVFGAHRFYAGKYGTGVLLLLTGGGLGVWWLVDLVLIALGRFRDADGERITRWT